MMRRAGVGPAHPPPSASPARGGVWVIGFGQVSLWQAVGASGGDI